MEIIRLGLIGCGDMMETHAKGIEDVEGIELTALCDIEPERVEAVANVLNKRPYVTHDYRTMLDHVDAVLVALPHDLHYECGMFFSSHKKHVLMEKPLCNTEKECLNLIKNCENNGVVLMCAYPVRFWPGVVKLKELVDSGDYGKVIQMSIWTEQLTQAFPKNGQIHWGATNRAGGGQFFTHGCHYVDILLWFLGNPTKGIHFGNLIGENGFTQLRETTSAAIFQFESGAVAYHGGTWCAKGTHLGYDFQVQCEKGLLEYDHSNGYLKLYDSLQAHKPGEAAIGDYKILWKREIALSKETQHEINHFLDCIRTGKKPLTDGYSALKSLQVIWKVYDAQDHDYVADLTDIKVR